MRKSSTRNAPPSWETLNADYITEQIKKTLDIATVPDVMDAGALEKYATEYERAMRSADSDNGGQQLLAELLEAKDRYETLKGKLATWLSEHPGERVYCDGHVARLAETTRTTTDYKAYFSQHPADLTPFKKNIDDHTPQRGEGEEKMHELMMNCLYMLAILLSVLGITAAILILIGVVKGIIDLINHSGGHDEE